MPARAAIDPAIAAYGPARVVEILAPLLTESRRARIEAVLTARLASLAPILEDTFDPHNAAAAIRTSEALGLAGLHAVEPCKGLTSHGVTRGCDRWLEITRWATPQACADALRARGFAVYATAPDATVTLDDVAVDRPVAVMFGNEHAGLSAPARAACDGALAIPMFGFTESFNLSVSVALVMSRLAARRRALLGRPGDLDVDTIATLRAQWYAAKLQGAPEIVARAVAGATRPDVAAAPRAGTMTPAPRVAPALRLQPLPSCPWPSR
ncbi:MAG: RNA methyltransferase [Kofleriaceae bacterium]